MYQLLDNPLVRALTWPRQPDEFREILQPQWRRGLTTATVVSVERHNDDVVSLQLAAESACPLHKAGQHVAVHLVIKGVRHQRTFSLSSASGQLEITVKRNGDGLVSNYIVDQMRAGDTLWLGQPQGDFVLPDTLPDRLLFVAGGSGITPLMAMLRALHQRQYTGELLFLNFTQSEQSLIFPVELGMLIEGLPNARLVQHFTRRGDERCDAELLQSYLQDSEVSAFVCGPSGMMQVATDALAQLGVERIHQEHFALAASSDVGDGLVHFYQTDTTAAGDAAGNLLELAEKSGLQPAYGCRMGICHACTCKVSGRIRDVRNGELKDVDNDDVQICVHAAAGGVKVDL